MKNILKTFLALSFVFVSFILSGQVSAEDKVVQSYTITTTAVREAKIVSQEKNIINFSFKISNEEGIQAGMKYGIQLIKETKDGDFVADEYTSDDVLSIGENTSISKTFTYTAPSNINGKYKVFILVKNTDSFILGIGYAGIIDLVSSTKGVEILTETCYLSVSGEEKTKYNLSQGVDIANTETLIIHCSAVNSQSETITANPVFETHYRTIYGDIVPQKEVENASIIFKAKEKKNISLLLPKALAPQAYDVRVVLKSGEDTSNAIIAHYVIQGVSATIQNLSFDKNSYERGETAMMNLSLSPSADSFPQNRAGNLGTSISGLELSVNIKNEKGWKCTPTIKQGITELKNNIEIPVSIKNNCENFTAEVVLKDKDGNIITEKSLTFDVREEPEEKQTENNIFKNTLLISIIFGFGIMFGIAGYFISLNKKENENNENTK